MSLIELTGSAGGLDDVEALFPDTDEDAITIRKQRCTLHDCAGRVKLAGVCPDDSSDARILHHQGDVFLVGECTRAQVDTLGCVHGVSTSVPAKWRIKARRDGGGPQPNPTDPVYEFTDCDDLFLELETAGTQREVLVLDGCNRVVATVKIDNASVNAATTYDAISLLGTGTKFTFYGQVTMPTSGNRQRYGLNVATTCTQVHNFMGPVEGVTAAINDPGANVTSH